MLEYNRECEYYTIPRLDGEVVALIELTPLNNYVIRYNPYLTPCSCGPFDSILDARRTLKKHRPTAELMEMK